MVFSKSAKLTERQLMKHSDDAIKEDEEDENSIERKMSEIQKSVAASSCWQTESLKTRLNCTSSLISNKVHLSSISRVSYTLYLRYIVYRRCLKRGRFFLKLHFGSDAKHGRVPQTRTMFFTYDLTWMTQTWTIIFEFTLPRFLHPL